MSLKIGGVWYTLFACSDTNDVILMCILMCYVVRYYYVNVSEHCIPCNLAPLKS